MRRYVYPILALVLLSFSGPALAAGFLIDPNQGYNDSLNDGAIDDLGVVEGVLFLDTCRISEGVYGTPIQKPDGQIFCEQLPNCHEGETSFQTIRRGNRSYSVGPICN